MTFEDASCMFYPDTPSAGLVTTWTERDLARMAESLRNHARLIQGERVGTRRALVLEAASLLDMAYSKFAIMDDLA